MTIMKKEKLDLSFGKFVKLALPFAIIQLVLATVYLMLLWLLGFLEV